MVIYKRNQQKKALAKVNNEDVIDQPDFAAYFHCASESTFTKKGLKFFDSNGAGTLNGTTFSYTPKQKGKEGLTVDLKEAQLTMAPEKRKMKWVEIKTGGEKFYFTSFSQGAFSVDTKDMTAIIERLKEIEPNL